MRWWPTREPITWRDTNVSVIRAGWFVWSWSVLGYWPNDPHLHGVAGYAFTRRGALRCVRRIISRNGGNQ